MSKLLFQETINQLEKLKSIYEILQIPQQEKKKIDEIIRKLRNVKTEDETQSKRLSKGKNKKSQKFSDIVELLFAKQFDHISGTKINYKKMNKPEQIVEYFDTTTKSKIFKEATALDLKLLYCLLVEEKSEIKGNKDEVYGVIKNNIRARKRGEAFGKM